MRATVHANPAATAVSVIMIAAGIFGAVTNSGSLWMIPFIVLALIGILGLFCTLGIRIYCGKTDFGFRGAFSWLHATFGDADGAVRKYRYDEITCMIISPFTVTIRFSDGSDIRFPYMCVSGLRTFMNIAKVRDVRYGK